MKIYINKIKEWVLNNRKKKRILIMIILYYNKIFKKYKVKYYRIIANDILKKN